MKCALTLAGHDPSGGAGLTADLKTFEAHGVYGFSVCSAITVQNDQSFEMVEWVKPGLIKRQIEVLVDRFKMPFVKIGIVESLEILDEVLDFLISKNKAVKIIWDPVIKASTGYDFHVKPDLLLAKQILEKCYLVTPNQPEWEMLFAQVIEEIDWSKSAHILVKGGHAEGKEALDLLYKSGVILPISGPRLEGDKHGTGCVLSSAITANLVMGESLENACFAAKAYISKFILSNDSLLGQHHYV